MKRNLFLLKFHKKKGQRGARGRANGEHLTSTTRHAFTELHVRALPPLTLPRPLKIMSWSIDCSESTTFAPSPAIQRTRDYFLEKYGKLPQSVPFPNFEEIQTRVKTMDDFNREFSKENGWSVVKPNHGECFTRIGHRPRRIPKDVRLAAVCDFIAKEAPDVLNLQDCDSDAIALIEKIHLANGNSFKLVGSVTVASTGLTGSFVQQAAIPPADAPPPADIDARFNGWQLGQIHGAMPFVTFDVEARRRDGDVSQSTAVTISNLDLTPVVKDLGMEGSRAISSRNKVELGFRPTNDDDDDDDVDFVEESELNKRFYRNLKQSLPKAARDAAQKVDNFTLQREVSLAFLGRGGRRLYSPAEIDPEIDNAECGNGSAPIAITPDIIVGNLHLRHGWSMDRMHLVLPHYTDAWEAAGRSNHNWETYAFYHPSSTPQKQLSSENRFSSPPPTNHRYFADVGAASIESRSKGGRYERCLLNKRLLKQGGRGVKYDVPRPMIEEGCSCSDQFPLIVTL